MRLETDLGSPIDSPTPEQIARAVRSIGAASGGFAKLSHGESFVQAAGGIVDGYVLEYSDRADAPQVQAEGVSLDIVVDAFRRFAVGDTTRDSALDWYELFTVYAAPSPPPVWLPDDFRPIATRLRNGERALDIRNDIVAKEGLSKLAAGKKVEAVEKMVRTAKASLAGGVLSAIALLILLLLGGSGLSLVLLGVATASQLGFALTVFSEYRQAPPDPQDRS